MKKPPFSWGATNRRSAGKKWTLCRHLRPTGLEYVISDIELHWTLKSRMKIINKQWNKFFTRFHAAERRRSNHPPFNRCSYIKEAFISVTYNWLPVWPGANSVPAPGIKKGTRLISLHCWAAAAAGGGYWRILDVVTVNDQSKRP